MCCLDEMSKAAGGKWPTNSGSYKSGRQLPKISGIGLVRTTRAWGAVASTLRAVAKRAYESGLSSQLWRFCQFGDRLPAGARDWRLNNQLHRRKESLGLFIANERASVFYYPKLQWMPLDRRVSIADIEILATDGKRILQRHVSLISRRSVCSSSFWGQWDRLFCRNAQIEQVLLFPLISVKQIRCLGGEKT